MGQVTAIEAIADPKTFTVVIRVKVELVRGSVKVSVDGQRFEDPHHLLICKVGAPGFEPGTFGSQNRRATKLRYAP